jgi:hypothetical protein
LAGCRREARRNPLEDITSTRRIRAVVADGRLYRRAELDSILEDLARQAR